MNDSVYLPLEHAVSRALISERQYFEFYRRSIEENDDFWREQGMRLDWITPYTEVSDVSFALGEERIRWYGDGTLNVCVNCVDRHLPDKADQTAIIWEGDEPSESRHISYAELYREVCRMARVLSELGVRKGDRVTLYLPMIPEAAYAMLACARIGAVHSVVFGGFSPQALAQRITDCGSKLLITADQGRRGGKCVPLKDNADTALKDLQDVQMLVICDGDTKIAWQEGRDHNYRDLAKQVEPDFPAVEMGAEDPLFILYTSGSTGAPKGVLHTSGGYLVYASLTHEQVFDYHSGDIYWCTADVGWITGHSYIVYGPLANGATSLMFEGVPTYPDVGRFWQVCDKHQVNIFYTAPTAIRALMREGDEPVRRSSRASLRLLGSVGEPINPQAWEWYYHVVGEARCPIVDTWWQTETGGILISPLPGATALKPGSATRPLPGIAPALVDDQGQVLEGEARGSLTLTRSWPGQMRTVYGNHQRFLDTYFSRFPGMYFTGDEARRDADGYYWITGRIDDVLNVSGHRLGTAEVESALVAHQHVAEAAVVGYEHEIKGQGIYAFVTLNAGFEPVEATREELHRWVREVIGAIAVPDFIQWAPGLPKTRSGKIMRRILRKIACDDCADFGDVSTLADPSVVDGLIADRQRRLS